MSPTPYMCCLFAGCNNEFYVELLSIKKSLIVIERMVSPAHYEKSYWKGLSNFIQSYYTIVIFYFFLFKYVEIN